MSIRDLASKLEISKDLSPESRDREYKGRVRQSFSAFGHHFSKMVLSNLLAVLFILPLLIIYFMYMPNVEKEAIAGMNFSGNLGIGYGVVDDTLLGIETLYSLRQQFVLFGLLPCLLVASIGICGLYYCCRNALWGTKLNVFRAFFRGVGKSWYKFLVAFAYLGVLSTGFVYTLLEIMKQTAVLGSAAAGLYVAIVFLGILAVPSFTFILMYFPMCVTYKYKITNDKGEAVEVSKVQNDIHDYKAGIKNSIITTIIMGFTTLIILVGLAAPLGLIFAGGFKFVVYIFLLMMGFSLYTILDLAFAQYTNDNFIYFLYVEQERMKQKEAQKAAKREAQKNKQQKMNNNNKKGNKKRKK